MVCGGWKENWREQARDGERPGTRIWTFSARGSDVPAWVIGLDIADAFPVFRARRGAGALPPPAVLESMTVAATSDLLEHAGLPDHVGWITRNLAAALRLASWDIQSWEGEEWAVDIGREGDAIAWVRPEHLRTPFAWLRARGATRSATIGTYQDDALFGLSFLPFVEPTLPSSGVGSLRPRSDLALARGPIMRADVVYDTRVAGRAVAGLVTEVVLHTASRDAVHLIAAEAYGPDEWRLYDESVVALSGLENARRVEWIPPRTDW